MYILGISAFYHDSSATLLKDGQIVAAAQEERFSRIKNDESFPVKAIEFCLKEAGINANEIDQISFYDKPFLKFERLLETYYLNAPFGWKSFVKAMPVWLKNKLFIKNIIRKQLQQKLGLSKQKKIPILFPEHHLSHAASAYYVSGFNEAALLIMDGVGEWATLTWGIAKENKITFLKQLQYPDSLGLLYSAFTHFCGFEVNSGEYKLMGLAPYASDIELIDHFEQLIKNHLVEIKPDGSLKLNQHYFNYSDGLSMIKKRAWEKLFNTSIRTSDTNISHRHIALAKAIQNITEEILLLNAKQLQLESGQVNLCMAGGVALNCVANSKLYKAHVFEKIFIQPASGDAGGSLGAALATYYINGDKPFLENQKNTLNNGYLGPEFSIPEIEKIISLEPKIKYFKAEEIKLIEITAEHLKNGKIIGWFQGKMEFGPRALGNRSILANPKIQDMQKTLNLSIKFREGFRPFAPIMLEEELEEYYEFRPPSEYMLFTSVLKEKYRVPLPANYNKLRISEKLKTKRSDLDAVVHVDYTSRVQTVTEKSNRKMFFLLHAFKKQTGIGILVNTSFNIKDEPIVCSPKEALDCFLKTKMDYLVMGDYIIEKVRAF